MIKRLSNWINKITKLKTNESNKLTPENIDGIFTKISTIDTTLLKQEIPNEYLNMRFNIKGTNSHDADSTYFGKLVLATKENIIKASWQIGFSNDIQLGIGFIKGNLLGINFYYIDNDERCEGRIIFYMNKEKNLQAYWQEDDIEGIGSEIAFPF